MTCYVQCCRLVLVFNSQLKIRQLISFCNLFILRFIHLSHLLYLFYLFFFNYLSNIFNYFWRNIFYKKDILWRNIPKNWKLSRAQCFCARPASFGQLGLNSDSQILSKFHSGISHPEGLENIISTTMKDRETF